MNENTYHDLYRPAIDITDEAGAAAYLEQLVTRHMRMTNHSREQAEAIERGNIGYYAGYFDPETRARVERLFQCEHPVFGAIATNGPPSLEEAFLAGVMRGLARRDRKPP